jgi:LL-diaminopimelate aminotransferase
MIQSNPNFSRLPERYLFLDIAKRVAAFSKANPDADIIRMGIGDVTRPLAPAVIKAMHEAVDDCAAQSTFHGYGPERGYLWLREAIAKYDYAERGVNVTPDDIFVNDGAKSDTGNIGDILAVDGLVGITDPVYPVYVDTNLMRGSSIRYITCNEENGYTGDIPAGKIDVIYLCYPNNPTGAVITKSKLKEWVDYALANGSLIMYDSAYEAFIRDPEIPHSIYEIEGARKCAIEFRSFSKTAGFTGIRCGYTVVPQELTASDGKGGTVRLNEMWERRQSCKFNGASYISQRGALAIYTPEGRAQIRATIDYYLETARIIRESMEKAGLQPQGGENAPYIWAHTPKGMSSWQFFDELLNKAAVVVTPGSGFGPAGEGYFRITSFADRDRTIEAMERIKNIL